MAEITLRAARVNAGLSQEDAATKIGRNRMTVYCWEKGRLRIDRASLADLAKIYGMSTEDIIIPEINYQPKKKRHKV